MQCNQRHFSQAQGTPFTVPPLIEILAWDGQTEAAEAILRGEFDVASLLASEATKAILKGLIRDKAKHPLRLATALQLKKLSRDSVIGVKPLPHPLPADTWVTTRHYLLSFAMI